MADFEGAWQVLDAQVASGRIPGYVAALRVGGQVEVRAGGRAAGEARTGRRCGRARRSAAPPGPRRWGGAVGLRPVAAGAPERDDDATGVPGRGRGRGP